MSTLLCAGMPTLQAQTLAPVESLEEPILPIEANVRQLPFQEVLIRDPLRKRKPPETPKEVSEIENKQNQRRELLVNAANPNRTLLLRQIYEDLMDIATYYLAVQQGQITSDLPPDQARNKSRAIHRDLLNFGKQLIKESIGNDERTAIAFQLSLIQAFYEESQKSAQESLIKLRSTNLHPERRKVLELVLAIFAAHDTEAQARREGLKRLDQLSNSLERRASTLAHLAAARSLAGYDMRGQKNFSAHPDYKLHLDLVSRFCGSLTPAENSQLFDFSLSLWSSSEDFRQDTSNVPFKVNCYQKAKQMPALLERLAISKLKSKQPDHALVLYTRIGTMVQLPYLAQQIDWRLLQIMRRDFQQEKGIDAFQTALIKSGETFKGTEYAMRVNALHHEFMETELSRAQRRDPAVSTLIQVRERWKRFTQSQLDSPSVRALKVNFVNTLIAYNFREEAVEELYSLASSSDTKLRPSHIERALQLYTTILDRDLRHPWGKALPVDRNKLQTLRKLLQLRLDIPEGKTMEDWVYELNLGLIDRDLGRLAESNARLNRILLTIPDRPLRERAFGLLAASAYANKDWVELERLMLVAVPNGIQTSGPAVGNLPTEGLLQLAIEEQTRSLAAARQTDKALQKSQELLSLLKPSGLRNEFLYLQASLYKDQGQFEKAVECLDRLVAEKVIDETYKRTLLELGRLKIGMGRSNEAAQTYAVMLQIAPQDERSLPLYEVMGDILRTQNKHQEARNHYKSYLSRSQTVEQIEPVAIKLLSLAQEQNRRDWIESDLKEYASTFKDQPKLRSLYLSYLYKADEGGKNLAKVDLRSLFNEEERQLLAVADLLSWNALQQASLQAEVRYNTVRNAIMRNESTIIDQMQNSYKQSYGAFLQACQTTYAGYCAPGLSMLLAEAKRYQELARDLVMPEDASSSSQAAKRDQFIEALETDGKALAQRMLEVARTGNTDPVWLANLASQTQRFWALEGQSSVQRMGFLDLPETSDSTKDPKGDRR
jgi:tetratricopeptide (TPR) repeat protein